MLVLHHSRAPGAPGQLFRRWAAAGLASVVLAGCAGRSESNTTRTADQPQPVRSHAKTAVRAHFVGSAVCISCHHDEGQKWLGSRHQLTLRPMDIGSLGRLAPPVGPVPGTSGQFRLVLNGGQYLVRQAGESARSLPLALALGSGKTGMTYVALDGDQVIEFRQSYFPELRTWFTTPGTEDLPDGVPGKLHPAAISRACILCHATALTGSSPMPQSSLFGVGCERCHGPGSAHVAAEEVGDLAGAPLPALSHLTGSQMNQLCGACHRTAASVDLTSLAAASTNRFQPYGLSLSRCFRESGGRLTCTTCHDPHTSLSTDTRRYEQICLSCHTQRTGQGAGPTTGAGSPAGARPLTGSVHALSCPVNPVNNCIGCHMPSRKAILDSPLPIRMVDHWIRIFKAHSP